MACRLLLLIVLVLALTAGPAAAELRVENSGQPALASSPRQPAVTVAVRGDCGDVYDAPEANGEPGGCSGSAWPGPGGDWGIALEVAAGDTLVLRTSESTTSLVVAGTTNFPAGLTTPSGTRVRNETLVGPVNADTSSDTPGVFTTKLPDLDPRARNGLAFAVVATGLDGTKRHYALSVRTPRKAAYGEQCSSDFYGPGELMEPCAGGKAPSPPKPPFEGPPQAPQGDQAATPSPSIALVAYATDRYLTVRVRVAQDGMTRARFAGKSSPWTFVRAGVWRNLRLRLGHNQRHAQYATVRVTQKTEARTVTASRRVRVVRR